MNAKVTIYTKPGCPYCIKAKALLDQKQVQYVENNVGDDPVKRAHLTEIANGRTTVPQIFINGNHVGGCDDLYALEDAGKLDPMLQSE